MKCNKRPFPTSVPWWVYGILLGACVICVWPSFNFCFCQSKYTEPKSSPEIAVIEDAQSSNIPAVSVDQSSSTDEQSVEPPLKAGTDAAVFKTNNTPVKELPKVETSQKSLPEEERSADPTVLYNHSETASTETNIPKLKQETVDGTGEEHQGKGLWKNKRVDIGLGIFGSLICSWLIDVGGTRRSKKTALEKAKLEITVQQSDIKTRWEQIEAVLDSYGKTFESKQTNEALISNLYTIDAHIGPEEYKKVFRSQISAILLYLEKDCTKLEEYLRQYAEDVETKDNILTSIDEFRSSAMDFVLNTALSEKKAENRSEFFTKEYQTINTAVSKITSYSSEAVSK